MKKTSLRRALVPGIAALALALTACGSDDSDGDGGGGGGGGGDDLASLSGEVKVDGSSTVYPMTVAASELFKAQAPGVNVGVGNPPLGSGGGFEQFCADKLDVSDASRPIKTDEDAEAPACDAAGIEYTELQVATDALTIVVHPDLPVDCLTVDQIAKLFGPDNPAKKWSDIDPSFPDTPIKGFIPGTDSGTYDYMANDVWENESEALRDDFQTSEDDNLLVEGVSGTEGGVGFFGYTYYEENKDTLKAVAVDGGDGCVEPSVETAQDGTYTPLARPLFIYVNNAKYNDNAAVAGFVDFYIDNLPSIADEGGFIPLSDELYSGTKDALAGIGG